MQNIPRTPEAYRKWWKETAPVPYPLCWCGCGGYPNRPAGNHKLWGHVAGEPVRFCHGHQGRLPLNRYTVNPDTDCWEWYGSCDSWGYGQVYVNGRGIKAHRYYYEKCNGPIPASKQLDHLCRNRRCVNPKHLEPVTVATNVRRGDRAKLTAEQVQEMRKLYASGNYKVYEVGKMFNISSAHASDVIRGKYWRNI